MIETQQIDNFYQGIDFLIDKRIQTTPRDVTTLMTIVDNTQAAFGAYKVAYESITDTAYSYNNLYSVGDRVWVLVPKGQSKSQKFILGKDMENSQSAFNYYDPFLEYDAEEIELNGGNEIKLSILANGTTESVATPDYAFPVAAASSEYLGISFELTTNLKGLKCINGSYRLSVAGRLSAASPQPIFNITIKQPNIPAPYEAQKVLYKTVFMPQTSGTGIVKFILHQSQDFMKDDNTLIKSTLNGVSLPDNIIVSNIKLYTCTKKDNFITMNNLNEQILALRKRVIALESSKK